MLSYAMRWRVLLSLCAALLAVPWAVGAQVGDSAEAVEAVETVDDVVATDVAAPAGEEVVEEKEVVEGVTADGDVSEDVVEVKDDESPKAPPVTVGNIHDEGAGIGPGHPFYALDSFGEQLQMAFTFNKKKRAERALKIAEEKMAELDGLKERVEFSEEGVKADVLKKAYKRYENRMQVVEASVSQVSAAEKALPELVERVAQKQAEHKAAFEEHKAAMPEEVRAHVEEQLQRVVERQREVVERVENPVAKARILENIAKHQDAYLERRKLWSDTQTYVHRVEAEARLGDEASPERAAELKARVEEKFQALERQREEQFQMMRQDFEQEKLRREEEHAAEGQKLEAAGFESREEAIEAYEALDDDGREKMRAFFGVGKEEADRVLGEIKELRAEHGDEWKVRLEERKREEMERERERMEEELRRREREFGDEAGRERGDIDRMRAEFERGGFEGGIEGGLPPGFEGGPPPGFEGDFPPGFEGGPGGPPPGFEGGFEGGPPPGFEGDFPPGFEGAPPRDGFEGAPSGNIDGGLNSASDERRTPSPRRDRRDAVPVDIKSYRVTPEPGFVPYDKERDGERRNPPDARERLYRDAPELPEGNVLAPRPMEEGFAPDPRDMPAPRELKKEIVPKEKYMPMSIEEAERVRGERVQPVKTRNMMPPVRDGRGSRDFGPVEVKEGASVEIKEVRPAEMKEVLPVEIKEVRPVETRSIVPVEVKEARPVEVKEAAPVETREFRPVEVKEVVPPPAPSAPSGSPSGSEFKESAPQEPPKDVVSSIMGALQEWFRVPEMGARLGADR